MLRLIPAPLHRLLYRVADTVRRQWWRVGRPRRRSVLVVAFDEGGDVLLVRHSYGAPVWSLPGGGMGRSEDPAGAAAREFGEELGCGLTGLTLLKISDDRVSGSLDQCHVFAARIVGEPVPDMREIVEVRFVDPRHLPERCGRIARQWIGQALAQYGAIGSPSQQR